MATPLPNQTTPIGDSMGRFLREAQASGRNLKSPAGRVLGRQFIFDTDKLVAATTYSTPERHRIVDQLRLGLVNFYVHLERKKSMYGFDPVRALDLLGSSMESITDAEFHQSITQMIPRTRDRHLWFYGRIPLGKSAVLPFTIERCWDGENVQYVVTKIASGPTANQLRVGALVTHWNSIPIERYVRLNANIFDGGNEAASLARSLAFLTYRSLSRFSSPLEEWVDLRFLLEGATYEERFTWVGFEATPPMTPSIGRNLTGFGGDLELLHMQHARRVRFAPASFDRSFDTPLAPIEPGVPQIFGSYTVKNIDGTAVDFFDYGSIMTEHGTFGYVRLFSFNVSGVDDLVNAFIPVLFQIPRNGLIIDMRGNSGGYIAAGERLLQLFTPQRVTPTRFEFRVTPAIRAMANATDEFQTWRPSIEEAFTSGEPYSQGYPMEGTDDDANQVGQKYFGPVVLISDALAFSTADIFAAGFIDHGIGRLLCTDENMAAAGGNNLKLWDHVRLLNPDFQLDPSFKATLDVRVISQEIVDAFNREGVSLSDGASLSAAQQEYDGLVWRVQDGTLTHTLRYLPWAKNGLYVYFYQSRGGLEDMPTDVVFGLTLRRCVRVRKNEGKLLEDLGIQPDVVYRMTFRDITDKNQDLNTRASLELSRMPVYNLDINVVPNDDGYTLVCRTLHITSLEVYAGQCHITGGPVSDDTSTELTVPLGLGKIEVRGLSNDTIVARAIISLLAL